MGKGNNKNCKERKVFGPLSGEQEDAILLYEELEALRANFGDEVADLTAPPSDKQKEKVAVLYGRSLGKRYQANIRGRGKKIRPSDDPDQRFRQMVDSHVIDDPELLKELSRQAGVVLRHHPDEAKRREAAGMLIMCNERMAQKIARKFHKQWGSWGYSYEEMLMEAQIGMSEAAEDRDAKRRRLWGEYRDALAEWEANGKENGLAEPRPPKERDVKVYDPAMGASFLTYAMQKMNMRIQRMLENNSEIRFGHRIPTETFAMVGKVLRAKTILQKDPQIQDSEITAERLLAMDDMKDFAEGKSHEQRLQLCEECLMMTSRRGVSLNQRVRAGDDSEYTERGHLMSDDRQNTAEDAEDSAMLDDMRRLMRETLTPEESYYLGALDFEGMFKEWPIASSDDELAERTGQSAKRIRLTRKEARIKLRKAMQARGWDVPMA